MTLGWLIVIGFILLFLYTIFVYYFGVKDGYNKVWNEGKMHGYKSNYIKNVRKG